MPSRTFGKFEVPKFYKLPVLEKPHNNVFSIILFLKTFKRFYVFFLLQGFTTSTDIIAPFQY